MGNCERTIHKKVFNLLLLCGALAVSFSLAYPQENASQQKSFFWAVRSKACTVHILGSVHALNRELYPLPKKIEDAFDQSDALAVEADINEINPETMMTMLDGAFYPDNDSLENHLSRETYELSAKKLQEVGLPIELFQKNKPWFLASIITVLDLHKLGFDPDYGIDKYFLKKAEGKKRIIELEGSDYQMRLLSGLSDAEQELFLRSTLIDSAVLKEEMGAIIKAWSAGDTKAVESLLTRSLREDPEMLSVYERLIDERNKQMASKIEGLLQTKSTSFVVVGAGHLVGTKGIIELLKKRGYLVEQR
jgi:uncharacterized protein YbaP (TraB family)